MEYITKINENGNIAVEDTILVKGEVCSAGSKMLSNFKPLFSAQAVESLEKAGYTVSGKTTVGEFGLDLLGETSYFGKTTDGETLVGATAKLVSEGKVKAGLSVDLNGYPRRSAAVSGVKFIKPTYGTVSRYGVIPCACSGEQIGVTAKTTDILMEILSVIAGNDKKDGTSLPTEKYTYTAVEKPFKLGLIEQFSGEVDKTVIEKLTANGCEIKTVSIKELDQIKSAWQILMSAETCNNISRYDGVKYGFRAEEYTDIDSLYTNSRTQGFGYLTKATLIYGSDVLTKAKYLGCYDKSLKIRAFAVKKLKELFGEVDALILPAYSGKKYNTNDTITFETVYNESKYTALASITGAPAIVADSTQFIANYFGENTLFGIAKILEK